jgi:Flp pilus assembly protein TadG
MALLIIPLIGMIGFAIEGGGFFLSQRGLQNAADSAALAAATNKCQVSATCGTTYAQEAKAVASLYGFVDGDNNVAVTSTANAPCPAGGSTCYRVQISKPYPVTLLRVLGFTGNTANGQTISAAATARPGTAAEAFCLIALATGLASNTNALTINNGSINLNGCNVYTNARARCNGSNGANNYYGIKVGYTVGAVTVNPCGASSSGGQPPFIDPYNVLKSNIPANTCGTPGAGTSISGTVNWGAYTAASPLKICGDLKLTGNVTVTTASPGSAVIIEKGNLNLNGFTLTASTSSGLTFVFSGLNTTTVGFVTGSGTLDFGAPKSGAWSGVALYQNPNLTTVTSPIYTGTPAFYITGLVYLPYANITISGPINHQTAGLSCLGLVARQVTLNGGGSIFSNTTRDCFAAGLGNLPTVMNTGLRPALVQ